MALRAVDALARQEELAIEADKRNKSARGRLAMIPVVDVDATQRDAARLEDVTAYKKAHALKLKAEYEVALTDYKTSVVDKDAAAAAAHAASDQAKLRAELERQISESEIAKPTHEEISAANAELVAAKELQAYSAKQQAMAQQKSKANDLAASAQEHAQEAIELRRKAKQTDEVLSEIVAEIPSCPLRVIDGRLVTNTKRGATFYADLSSGERWRIALDIAIQAVGTGGLLVIPQEAWEGLDPANRTAIDAQAKAAQVVVLTAECSADEGIAVKQ